MRNVHAGLVSIRFCRMPKMPDDEIDFDGLWQHLAEQISLDVHSIHGPGHWRRVEKYGLKLAAATVGADPIIVRLFAAFHDSRRISEFTDHQHGLRGGELAQLLHGDYFQLT